MLEGRSDFALDRDALGRYLPWLVAFMVYLAVLALTGTLLLNAAAQRWDRNIGATLTVQVPPGGSGEADRATVGALLSLLRGMPDVVRAEALPDAQLMRMIEPWVGPVGPGDLPLPRLIDVETKPGAAVDVPKLRQRLAQVASGVVVDDHRVWLSRLVGLVRSVEALAFAVLALIAVATIGTVVFTTRTGLAIHREAIEVLHLIGAQDSYVANQFAGRALGLGIKGGLIGLAFAVPTVYGIGQVLKRMEGGLLPEFSLAPEHWAAIVVLPFVVAAIAMLTARLTVTRTLARML